MSLFLYKKTKKTGGSGSAGPVSWNLIGVKTKVVIDNAGLPTSIYMNKNCTVYDPVNSGKNQTAFELLYESSCFVN